jgi:hypothetical protein
VVDGSTYASRDITYEKVIVEAILCLLLLEWSEPKWYKQMEKDRTYMERVSLEIAISP